MSLSDFLLFGEALGGGGGGGEQSALLRKLCELYNVDVSDTDTVAELDEKASSVVDVWEYSQGDGKDVLGEYKYYPSPTQIVSGDTVFGYFRLKKPISGYCTFFRDMVDCGVDFSNLVSPVGSLDFANSICGARTVKTTMMSGAVRCILPETFPMYLGANGSTRNKLFAFGPCPAKIYLSKHMANNLTNSSMFTAGSNSKFSEELVVAPKDMDAQFHLHKFTKMTAETIVGILENLADVTDRDTPYTLTLGATNLAKITEEQKNIARMKGWSLA